MFEIPEQDYYEEQLDMWFDREETDDRLNSLIDMAEDYWENKEDIC